ncbi:MAG: NUDIX hydrolase [Firmicutes bacterium]|jgi:ADP-ribose pyrophosphatase|nr:NUDIX hydrolase [Bacillota bacterium]
MEKPDLTEKKLRGSLVYDGSLLKVHRDEVLLPGGKKSAREWIDHPGAAAVIPVLPGDRVVLVRQFRYPIGRETLEIPAGKLDPGESPAECAKREVAEETGFYLNSLQNLGAFLTTVGFTNEIIHLFYTADLAPGPSGRQRAIGPDEDEHLSVVIHPLSEVLRMIDEGLILDAKTIIAFFLAQRKGLL